MRKKILVIVLFIIASLVTWQYELISYGIKQGLGQMKIVNGSVPIDEYLEGPAIPDSIRYKLQLVQEVKEYAITNLGINPSDNYSTFYDQKGKPLLWVVTASEEFDFIAKTWDFPFLGTVSYKGYFDLPKARELQQQLVDEGWDTSLREVGGWSTLGWFSDPVLSNMLRRSDGDLTELIIHELTHGTIFVKDSVQFNENLATFIGQQGAIRFLQSRFGDESIELNQYKQGLSDRLKFSSHILRGSDRLDSLYHNLSEDIGDDDKRTVKDNLIELIVSEIDTISFNDSIRYRSLFEQVKPNNAYFMSFQRYRAKQDQFVEALEEKHNGDLAAYLSELKRIHPSL